MIGRFLRIAIVIPAVAAVPLSAQQRAPSDSARLQGHWTMVSGSAGGYPMPPEMLSTMKRFAAGNEVTITMNEAVYFKATFKLNSAGTPRAIDYQMTAGPTAGSAQLGIYEISGDTVRFSFASPGKPRPQNFDAGGDRTVSVWVKVRP